MQGWLQGKAGGKAANPAFEASSQAIAELTVYMAVNPALAARHVSSAGFPAAIRPPTQPPF